MWIKYLIPVGLVFVAVVTWYYAVILPQQSSKSATSPTNSNVVSYQTSDGVKIYADYYPSSGDPLDRPPVVVLVHQLGKSRKDWGELPAKLQQVGFSVLALDLRGHGDSTDKNGQKISYTNFTPDDWSNLDLDLHATMDFLPSLKVNLDRLYLIGASIGANSALVIAPELPNLKGVVLLSPGEDYHGIKSYSAATTFKGGRALVVASFEDTQSYEPAKKIVELIGSSATFVGLTNGGHGMDLLKNDPNLTSQIIQYLLAS